MGKVYANVTIENAFDRERTRSALIPEAVVRHVHYNAMLADSGATTLCLPAEAIAELGLPFLDEVRVGTATGVVPARLFEGARITVDGRTRTVECLELPGGREPLLGVFPTEILGIDLDLKNERIILRPEWGDETSLTIL